MGTVSALDGGDKIIVDLITGYERDSDLWHLPKGLRGFRNKSCIPERREGNMYKRSWQHCCCERVKPVKLVLQQESMCMFWFIYTDWSFGVTRKNCKQIMLL